jgi:hypothetical protein
MPANVRSIVIQVFILLLYGVRRLAAALLCPGLPGRGALRRFLLGLLVPASGSANPRCAKSHGASPVP